MAAIAAVRSESPGILPAMVGKGSHPQGGRKRHVDSPDRRRHFGHPYRDIALHFTPERRKGAVVVGWGTPCSRRIYRCRGSGRNRATSSDYRGRRTNGLKIKLLRHHVPKIDWPTWDAARDL